MQLLPVQLDQKAPDGLAGAYDPRDVMAWDPERFTPLKQLQGAMRNQGVVLLMYDSLTNRMVAVKRMPSSWTCGSHAQFLLEHPAEVEMPWQDIGTTSFLGSVNFPYICRLDGVYCNENEEHMNVVSEWAEEGDLFSWTSKVTEPPGIWREAVLWPLIKQIAFAVMNLHELSIVHRDISLENIVISNSGVDTGMYAKIIDFGMASTHRSFQHSVRGKPSYQAPEVHTDQEYNGSLADVFALGVLIYALLVQDYPWMSTKPGGCKCFNFVKQHGLRAYLNRRKRRGSTQKVIECMSDGLVRLLEGLLAIEPERRLTLNGALWQDGEHASVWDEPWFKGKLLDPN